MLGCAEEVLVTWGVVSQSHSPSLDADLAAPKFYFPTTPASLSLYLPRL